MWRHSQVVRQRSATPLSPGSNPGDASKKRNQSLADWFFFFCGITPLCEPFKSPAICQDNSVRNFLVFNFRVTPPTRVDKKDAKRHF